MDLADLPRYEVGVGAWPCLDSPYDFVCDPFDDLRVERAFAAALEPRVQRTQSILDRSEIDDRRRLSRGVGGAIELFVQSLERGFEATCVEAGRRPCLD